MGYTQLMHNLVKADKERKRVERLETALTEDDIIIDRDKEIVTIYGIRYAMDLFRAIGCDGLPIGACLKIVTREDGVVTLERVYP